VFYNLQKLPYQVTSVVLHLVTEVSDPFRLSYPVYRPYDVAYIKVCGRVKMDCCRCFRLWIILRITEAFMFYCERTNHTLNGGDMVDHNIFVCTGNLAPNMFLILFRCLK